MQENRSGFNGISVNDLVGKVDIYPLMKFYNAESLEELVRAQAHHVLELEGYLNEFKRIYATKN